MNTANRIVNLQHPSVLVIHGQWLGCLIATLLFIVPVAPAHAFASLFFEDFGNFPDAVAVSAEFDTFGSRTVNGNSVSGKTGFIFSVENTSYSAPDGAAAFRDEPDGHFASSDELTNAAATAISNAQPFGIFEFGTNMLKSVAQDLKDGVLMAFMPTGFVLNVEHLAGADPEVNFFIDNTFPDGLLFDDSVPTASIPSQFTNPRTGTLEFFIEVNRTLDEILDATSMSINERGLDVKTEMAWVENGSVQTQFHAPGESFDGQQLRPRGQLVVDQAQPPEQVPEPATLSLLLLALAASRFSRLTKRA